MINHHSAYKLNCLADGDLIMCYLNCVNVGCWFFSTSLYVSMFVCLRVA